MLKELAFLVKGYLSNNDLFGLWGGEEFLILTYKSGEDAFSFVEYLRKQIKEHHFRIAGRQTVSIGVTEYIMGKRWIHCLAGRTQAYTNVNPAAGIA